MAFLRINWLVLAIIIGVAAASVDSKGGLGNATIDQISLEQLEERLQVRN
jgi:hypothetical protein